MKKFGTKARNTIAIMLILTFACMFVQPNTTYDTCRRKSAIDTRNTK